MRKQFSRVLSELIQTNPQLYLLLGDIGVYSFMNATKSHPRRVLNMGINEQSMVSFGAGLAKEGYYPILHSITPFLISRAYEQIKLDFGYQNLKGLFVGVGGSFEYSKLGSTHHGKEDIALLRTIEDMNVYTPFNSKDLDSILRKTISNRELAYVRLSEREFEITNKFEVNLIPLTFKSSTNLVIIFGSFLQEIFKSLSTLDCDIFGSNKLLDYDELRKLAKTYKKIIFIEPWIAGSSFLGIGSISDIFMEEKIYSIGLNANFTHEYGTYDELLKLNEFDKENIYIKVKKIVET